MACADREEYCEFGMNGHPWGDCRQCAGGLGCSGNGMCLPSGLCECEGHYFGSTCAEHEVGGGTAGWVVPLIAALGSAAGIVLIVAGVLLARFLVRQYHRGRRAEDAQLEAKLTRIDTALQNSVTCPHLPNLGMLPFPSSL